MFRRPGDAELCWWWNVSELGCESVTQTMREREGRGFGYRNALASKNMNELHANAS